MAEGLSYRDAGVDRDVAERAKARIGELVASTETDGVVSDIGAFGGLFRVPAGLTAPVLAASADGVGTKLKVAIRAGRHDTVGHDLVNHCVNDILVEGARPLFFMDYIGMGTLEEGVVAELVTGLARGCRENGCALLGGETAEMPDFYGPGEYDLAGFIVGVVEEDARTGPDRVRAGDVLIGLGSDGFHTNGYSLLRRLVFRELELGLEDPFPGTAASVEEILLRVHRSYVRAVMPLLAGGGVHALAHITGGGIPGNLDRALPDGLRGRVRTASWEVPPEFRGVMESGVEEQEMFRTFNMGVGMVLVVGPESAESVVSARARALGCWAPWTSDRMTERPSYWSSLVAAGIALAVAGGAAAQTELGGACAGATEPSECNLAAATAQVIQPRVGLALWGGNPVPGTGSTMGFRVGSSPRISGSLRFRVVPTTLPPLLDRTRNDARTGLVTGLGLQSSVALVHGTSLLPTVGGFLSVDAIGRLAVASLPTGKGFDDGSVWGGALGLRLGLLRESFTLPGLSITATYGRSTTVTFGDPELLTSAGLMRGSVSALSATAVASRWVFGLRLAGGVSWDRFGSRVTLHYDGAPAGSSLSADAVLRRWSGFGSLTWSRLIYHAAVEIGVQETPTFGTLPAGENMDPVAWWVALSFRVTP